jgi:hypothetical protein
MGALVAQDLRPNLIATLEYGQQNGLLGGSFLDAQAEELSEMIVQVAERFHNPLQICDLQKSMYEAIGVVSLALDAHCGHDYHSSICLLKEEGLIEMFTRGWAMIADLELTIPQTLDLMDDLSYQPGKKWSGVANYAIHKRTIGNKRDHEQFRNEFWHRYYAPNVKFNMKGYKTLLLSLRILPEAVKGPLQYEHFKFIFEHLASMKLEKRRTKAVAYRLMLKEQWRQSFLEVDINQEVLDSLKRIQRLMNSGKLAQAMMDLFSTYRFDVEPARLTELVNRYDFKDFFNDQSTFDLISELKFLDSSSIKLDKEKARVIIQVLLQRDLTFSEWQIVMQFPVEWWLHRFDWRSLNVEQLLKVLGSEKILLRKGWLEFEKVLLSGHAPSDWLANPIYLRNELRLLYSDAVHEQAVRWDLIETFLKPFIETQKRAE